MLFSNTNNNKTFVLDEIFDPDKGWTYSRNQVPLQRKLASNGNPYYIVNVDGTELMTFEQREWSAGVQRSAPAARLVAMTTFVGITLTNAAALLRGGYDTRGLPSFGVDENGSITMHTAFPIAPNFPVDIARGQLLVCMGTLSEEARDLLAAWTKNPAVDSKPGSKPAPGQKPNNGSDWSGAKGVASVAGSFLRGLLGI